MVAAGMARHDMRSIDGCVAWGRDRVVWYALHWPLQNLQSFSSIAGGLVGPACGFVVLRMAPRKHYTTAVNGAHQQLEVPITRIISLAKSRNSKYQCQPGLATARNVQRNTPACQVASPMQGDRLRS